MANLNHEALRRRSEELVDEAVPVLTEYIGIPNKSPDFDPEWKEHGHMDKAVALFVNYAEKQKASIPGLSIEVQEIEGRTPLIFMKIPGRAPGNVLLYGHLDKQPESEGWTNGRHPWTPQREGDRLYGRGGADDGYAMFGALAVYRQLAENGVPYAEASIIIEADEESGSKDLPAHLEKLSDRIGSPDTVICLDSGTGDYETFWETTSLRGIVVGTLKVGVLKEGIHSGSASGSAPDSYMIANELIRRIQDPQTGEILLPELNREIPSDRVAQAKALAEALKGKLVSDLPILEGVQLLSTDLVELILNKTWRPALTVTGANLPPIADAGNVLRPETELKLSMRVPPGMDAKTAARAMKETLEKDPPYGARVAFDYADSGVAVGWSAPETAPWLRRAMDEASQEHFGKQAMAWGEGGTIPFMAMLGNKFPEAQFVITGVLGPGSNAHGPNEFLDIGYMKRLVPVITEIVASHGEHMTEQELGPRPYQP